MRRAAVLLMVAVLMACVSGCATREVAAPPAPARTNPPTTVEDIAASVDVHLAGDVAETETVLPTEDTDATWSLMQSAAAGGGYDLGPYAGRRVTLKQYSLVERYDGHAMYLWLVESDSKVVGAYETVPGAYPGIVSLGRPDAGK